MIINFEYGLIHKGFEYGWYKKDLYRLPSTSNNKNYGFKKLASITIGHGVGYRLKTNKMINYFIAFLIGWATGILSIKVFEREKKIEYTEFNYDKLNNQIFGDMKLKT